MPEHLVAKPGNSCPVDGCTNKRGEGKLVCFSCWRLVPRALGVRLYAAWNDGDMTDDYDAAREAVLDVCSQKRARR
jgi:hypothetical protein